VLHYIATLIATATGWSGDKTWDTLLRWGAPILAGLQAWLFPFWHSQVFVVLTLFWGLDWLLGGLVAWRADEWNAKRAFWSIWKLLTWHCGLLVAFALRWSGVMGGGLAAGIVEAAIIMTEGASVLRNLGLLWPNSPVGKVLSGVASKVGRQHTAEDASPKKESK